MSELVFNEATLSCCGMTTNACRCHHDDDIWPAPEPVVNVKDFDPYAGRLQDDSDLLPLPVLNEAEFCSPGLRTNRKPADPEEDETDENEVDDEDDIVAQNHRRLFGNNA